MSSDKQRVLLIDHSGTSLAIISKLIAKHIPSARVDVLHVLHVAPNFFSDMACLWLHNWRPAWEATMEKWEADGEPEVRPRTFG